MFRRVTLPLILAAIVVGCGYDPSTPAYNTSANQDKFPADALNLLDGIESGRLADPEAILAEFGDLYSNNSQLLDDPRWLKVIERLGSKFRFRAEQFVGQGMKSYLQAARFFGLASLARPTDSRLRARHQLFATWEKAVADSVASPNFDPQKSPLDLKGRLTLLKYFLLGDSAHQRFAQEFVLPQILAGRSLPKALNSSTTHDFPAADQCFLDVINVRKQTSEERVGGFIEPRVDLVAVQIVPQHGDWYAAELYFRPLDSMKYDYTVALEMTAPDSSSLGRTDGRLLAFDFHPTVPTTRWRPNKIAAAYRWFRYGGPVAPVSVGVYTRSGDSTAYVRVQDSGEPLLVLPPTIFVSR